MKEPNSMDECFYFTNRTIQDGKVRAWVFKPDCPKCGKAKMGKPVEKGKVKVRAKEYVCPSCSYTVDKEEFEPTLTMNIIYTCPFCGSSGDTTTAYKRKTWQGVPAYVFECEKCGKKIGITKKMKEPKK